MALFPEDNGNFDYKANGYYINDNVNVGSIQNAQINVKYQRAIAVSLIHGNTAVQCASSLKECYNIAVEARKIYLNTFRERFPVSAEAMAWEIWIHATPEVLDRVINNKIVRIILGTSLAGKIAIAVSKVVASHTEYADIGINDNLRNFDSFFEKAYKLIY
ncbi:hypothetical protein ACIQXI_10490 [Lysinibacillus sp. NPDC097195]|uniref:hypothetical protein n=1 Tax=Lysinibacillus sp. NPDC097195 TaxID=3364141 RepID=UPI00380B0702